MIDIMLVDDEVLAMEYLKNMMDWEQYGYRIAGCAINGKKALELYDKILPDMVISDIRMPGMDGIELTKRLKEKNPNVVVILLSAYKDFEYAQKGIQYGVSNYILKHELSEGTLREELWKVKEQIERDNKKEKIYQTYFMNQLIHDQTENLSDIHLGNRLFLILIHKSNQFVAGSFREEEWNERERRVLKEVLERGVGNKVSYVADVRLTSNNLLALYRIENISSKYTVNTLIECKVLKLGDSLREIEGCRFNILYSYEITQKEISRVFRMMSRQIRYAAFWEPNRGYHLNVEPLEEEKITWSEQIGQLREKIYRPEENPKQMVAEMFSELVYPQHRLDGFKSLIHLLDNLDREIREEEGIARETPERMLYTIEEIRQYYENNYDNLHRRIHQNGEYSRQVQEIIRYIRRNFHNELSLEILGKEFQMNGVYLGQIFKKEVGITFLKYLTNVRMEEAKRLLWKENCTVSEVADQVGYRTSQYFSHIFTRTVGIKPQEYKRWKERDERKDN